VLDRNLAPARFDDNSSPWLRSFSLAPLKVLVVCRGPVRQEAFDVFDRIGVGEYGMLLSEKDSVTYPRCLAPELRRFRFPNNVHRLPDYMGVGQEQKQERIREILAIAKAHRYTHLFAGYGFMAEDAEFIAAIEQAGLGFMGPSARVARRAGAKDEAKKLARSLGNAVIPGVDDVSSRALLKRHKDRAALERLAKKNNLDFTWQDDLGLGGNAEALLQQGYAHSVELVPIADLQEAAAEICAEMWREHPKNRIRFKHIGGGGGKGQRVVGAPDEVASAIMEVLAESKVVEPGSNRNFLVELNVETTRHNEIQLVATAPGASHSADATARCRCTSRSCSRSRSRRSCSTPRSRIRPARRPRRSCAATRARWHAWRPRPSASGKRPGSTRFRPSSASSKASATSSWR